MAIEKKKSLPFLYAAVAVILTVLPAGTAASAQDTIKVLLTSNLEGNFSISREDRDRTDPILLMGQSIIYEQGRGAGPYFDLGNAFYPGLVSKFSYGAPMMDFFSFMNCRSSLVSSEDIRLGAESLEYLQKEGETKLLSANILREKSTLFTPYILEKTRKGTFAFVGLSSKKVLFDAAEQKVLGMGLADELTVMGGIVNELKEKNVSGIVLLSGLEYNENMALLNRFNEIDLVITGGDNKGQALNAGIVRIDRDDGRSIVTIPSGKGYCLLTLSFDKRITIRDMAFREAGYHPTDSQGYRNFVNRLAIWKEQFIQESEKELVSIPGKTIVIDSDRVSNLLRDRYRSEISLLPENAVMPLQKEESLSYMDILSAVRDNYAVYNYRIKGGELLAVRSRLAGYRITGIAEDGKVQGYAVNPKRNYGIVSTQTGYEAVRSILGRDIPYRNTWKTIPEVISADFIGDRVIMRENYAYLERRFRTFTDVAISFFYDTSKITYTKDMNVPVGEPGDTYYKWGIEGRIDFTVYNRYHKLTFTPYVNYSRQNQVLQNNLMRGTFSYALNLGSIVSPYHKIMADTVVTPIRNASSLPQDLSTAAYVLQFREYREKIRPTTLRETLGAEIQTILTGVNLSGKAGFGYEKKVRDPVEPFTFGFEFTLKVTYDFLRYFSYGLEYDSFVSFIGGQGSSNSKEYLRSELKNRLSVKITEELRLSLKHRWFYYYLFNTNERYSNSQIITSLDLVTDFKL